MRVDSRMNLGKTPITVVARQLLAGQQGIFHDNRLQAHAQLLRLAISLFLASFACDIRILLTINLQAPSAKPKLIVKISIKR